MVTHKNKTNKQEDVNWWRHW